MYTTIGRGEDAEVGVVSNRRPTVRTGVFAWVGRSGKAWVEWVYVLVGDSHRGFRSYESVLWSRCRYSIAENASPEPFDAGTVLPFE